MAQQISEEDLKQWERCFTSGAKSGYPGPEFVLRLIAAYRAQAEETAHLKARGVTEREITTLGRDPWRYPHWTVAMVKLLRDKGLLIEDVPIASAEERSKDAQCRAALAEGHELPSEVDPLKVDVTERRYAPHEMEVRIAHNALVESVYADYHMLDGRVDANTERLDALEKRIESAEQKAWQKLPIELPMKAVLPEYRPGQLDKLFQDIIVAINQHADQMVAIRAALGVKESE